MAAAASAKARQFIKDDYDLERFARLWSQNVRHYMSRNEVEPNRVLVLRYEELLAKPAEHLDRLSSFTGVSGFHPSVLSVKINCPEADGVGMNRTRYVPPIELMDSEIEIIERVSGREMQRLGYFNSKDVRSDCPHQNAPRHSMRSDREAPRENPVSDVPGVLSLAKVQKPIP